MCPPLEWIVGGGELGGGYGRWGTSMRGYVLVVGCGVGLCWNVGELVEGCPICMFCMRGWSPKKIQNIFIYTASIAVGVALYVEHLSFQDIEHLVMSNHYTYGCVKYGSTYNYLRQVYLLYTS